LRKIRFSGRIPTDDNIDALESSRTSGLGQAPELPQKGLSNLKSLLFVPALVCLAGSSPNYRQHNQHSYHIVDKVYCRLL